MDVWGDGMREGMGPVTGKGGLGSECDCEWFLRRCGVDGHVAVGVHGAPTHEPTYPKESLLTGDTPKMRT